MIISQCPRCRERFRVPSGPIPEDAYAHCPWCRETFPIADFLRSLPPLLEIVSADGKPLAVGEPATGVGTSSQLIESSRSLPVARSAGGVSQPQRNNGFDSFELSDEDDRYATIADEPITETIADDEDGDPYSTWDGSRKSPLESMNVSTRSGGRKRKGSGVGTFIGIVLGGLASVPIAGGLLSLMGRSPDWGFWPFQGEQVSSTSVRAAPLPESDAQGSPSPFATETPSSFGPDQSSLDQSVDPTLSAAQQIIDDEIRVSADSEDPSSAQSTQVSETAEPVNTAQADDSAVIPPDESERRFPEGNGDQEIASSEPASSEPASSEPASSLTPAESDRRDEAEQPAAIPIAPTTAATPTPEALSDAEELAQKATQMIDVMSQYEGEEKERNRRIGLTYQTIASAVGLADESGESLESMAEKIVTSPLREDIRSAGWDWLAYASRPSDGIALIGRATVSDEGEFLIDASGERIALISQGEISEDQDVLVLGCLVNQGSSLRVVYAQPIP